MNHYAILIENQSSFDKLAHKLIRGESVDGLEHLSEKKGALFSRSEIERFIDEEEYHDLKLLTSQTPQALKTMSSGEQKKALLDYLLKVRPDFLILVNAFDNLDLIAQEDLKKKLVAIADETSVIQVVSRKTDIVPMTTHFATSDGDSIQFFNSEKAFLKAIGTESSLWRQSIPKPLHSINVGFDNLVVFKNVAVSYEGSPIVRSINWTIKKGEFWQLIGPNGSGKTTLLSMITGDNHKGYGQDLTLFGYKKGSGESVWDLKEHIGYFTPAMTDKFRGYHSLENMIISGLYDSIGLYIKPTDTEKRLAVSWLKLLGLESKKKLYFHQLSRGEKRLVMTARAMIKHPPLLILDEPTAGLDDNHAHFFVALVNKIAEESKTAIIFVSHRREESLKPDQLFELIPEKGGSIGKIHYI